jgi:Ca-activated chloride channel family protein
VDGYFTLVIQPPERFPESDVTPKEMVFVLDSSGSMNGFPEAKSKRLIDYAIDGLYPGDTFNVIKFSGDTDVLFEQPVYPTAENVARAKAFVDANWGGGGTEMMDAIRAALAPSGSADHVRIVVFLTDGYVGNDLEIIGEIQQHPNARIFAYGIGASVNRFLLDKMAEAGNGAVEYVSQKHDDQEAETVAHRLYERLRAPLLTDIALDFGSLPVAEVYPRRIPDLFSARPVVITGRYNAAGHGVIRLLAKRAGDPYTREIPVSLPALQQDNPVLASLWARGKIDDLMTQDWTGLQQHTMSAGLRNQIAQLGLDYRLMTPFTSFVAVEERVVTDGGKPQRIQVPVELPEGVQYEPGWSVETQSTAVGMLISAKQMQNLPLNGRNFTDLMQSAPGVTWINPNGATATSQRYGIQSNYAVAGSRPVGQAYVLNNAGVASPPVPSPTPAPRPVRPIETKLHPRLVAAYDCWQAQADKANAPKACNLEGDKLAVMVVLAGDLNAGLSRLKAIGFKPAPGVTRGKRLVGHISVGQLAALAEISAVQFVAPAA